MLTNDLKYIENENEEIAKSSKCYSIVTISSSVLFAFSVLSYLVCAIAFLIGDFKEGISIPNCHLWYYILGYLCLLLIKLILLKYECCLMKVNFCNTFIFLTIEILFLVFGLNNILLNNVCEDLNNTNLMNIGFATLILQSVITLVYLIFFVIFIITELCKIKTPCCCTD
jgi:hypothetical protein